MEKQEWMAHLGLLLKKGKPIQLAGMAGAAVLVAAQALAASEPGVHIAPVPHKGANVVLKLWKEAA